MMTVVVKYIPAGALSEMTCHNEAPMRAVIVKSSQASGLGDLLKSALAGVAYAMASDRRIYIDWSGNIYNYGFGQNLFYTLFDLKKVRQLDCLPVGNDDVHPASWRGSLEKSFTQLWADHGEAPWNRYEAIRTYSFDLGRVDYPESVLVMWDFDQFHSVRRHIPGYGPQTGNDYQAMAAVFARHMKLKDALQQRIDAEWARIAGGQNVLGVHIRLTNESIHARGAISIETYIECIHTIIKQTGITRIFLATDNKYAQKKLIMEFGDAVFVVDKWFGKPGEALHLNNSACPDAWENIIGAISDIFLLARCAKIVCQTNSSFSQSASIVGDIHPDSIIDVASGKKMHVTKRVLGGAKRFLGRNLQIGGR
jgi:hypothetical protein